MKIPKQVVREMCLVPQVQHGVRKARPQPQSHYWSDACVLAGGRARTIPGAVTRQEQVSEFSHQGGVQGSRSPPGADCSGEIGQQL